MYSVWFGRFVGDSTFGDDIRPDTVMCIGLLIEIHRQVEQYLERCETPEGMLNVSLQGVLLIYGFCGGLIGE
jgi:hypothetical protein